MKIKYLLLIALLTSTSLFAAKIPSQVKKSVAFIFVKDSSDRLTPQGTGFFVLLIANQKTDTAKFGYLVTAKSTLKKPDGAFFDTVYIRINRKDGYCDTLNIPLTQNGIPPYFTHPDSIVDLAIIPAYPDANRYDFLFTPVGMIAPMDLFKKENIAEGDEVFYTGMLGSHIGIFKNIPVVRFGKIVQMSDEKYLWEKLYAEFYLVEMAISKESKGSPLYFYAESSKDTGNVTLLTKFFLVGIVSGNYGESNGNAGLARVIPAYKLFELLNIPAVMMEREKEFTRMQNVKPK